MDRILYVSQGKLHLHAEGACRTIESKFGNDIRQRALELNKRNAWKTEGRGAQFMSGGMLWGRSQRDPAEMPISISGVSRGCEPGEVLYTLHTPEIGGVFSLRNDGAEERRLFHSAEIRPEQLCASPQRRRVLCVVRHRGEGANIAVMKDDCTDLNELTQGDCIEGAPRWIEGSGDQIVFHSAGIGRTSEGYYATRAPYSICRMDLESGEITVVAEDPANDLLAPQYSANGDLYFIRRPYQDPSKGLPVWRMALDLLLLPFRLLRAIFSYLNFFSAMYSGKPLISSGGTRAQNADFDRMMVYGNLIEAGRQKQKRGEECPDMVPDTWQLVRRSGGADKVLAKGVLSYDLCRDGGLVYSNGSAVFRLTPEGRAERIAKDSFIQQVAAV